MESFSISEKILEQGLDWILSIVPSLLGAVTVAVVGWIAIGWFTAWLHRFFERVDFDEALETFIESVAGVLLKILLVVVVVSMLGVQTSSFVAVLGAMSLAVGLALQGSLANFAGGVLILVFKPFKVGDTINTDTGYKGTVKQIQVFSTVLESPTKETVILPNGELSNKPLINVTGSGDLAVEYTFGIGYDDDIEKAKAVVKGILDDDDKILSDQGYKLGVRNLGTSSVDIFVRVSVQPNDYWNAVFDINEQVKKSFDEQGISFAYPQMDVHVDKHE